MFIYAMSLYKFSMRRRKFILPSQFNMGRLSAEYLLKQITLKAHRINDLKK